MNRFILLLLSSLFFLTACEKIPPTLTFDWGICEAGADSQEVLVETNREVVSVHVWYASGSQKEVSGSEIELNERGEGYYIGDWFILEVQNGETCQIRISAAPNDSGCVRWLQLCADGRTHRNPPLETADAVFYQSATGKGRTVIPTPNPTEDYQRGRLIVRDAEENNVARLLWIHNCKSFWVKDEDGRTYTAGKDNGIDGPWFKIRAREPGGIGWSHYLNLFVSANETGHWRALRFYVERNDGKTDATLVVQKP